jgi:hypothetical protein
MTGCIYQVERVIFAIFGTVGETDSLALYGNAALPLYVHVVEDLVLEISLVDYSGVLYQPVRERGFAMIDMGDYTEITYIFFRHGYLSTSPLEVFISGRPVGCLCETFRTIVFSEVLRLLL